MVPYIPQTLPLQNIDHARLIKLVGDANGEIARFDGLLHAVVKPELLLAPLTTNEAVLSSRIEGTQATLDDVLEFDAGIEMPENLKDDIQEIVNYRKALLYSQSYLLQRPISLQFIRELHQILLDSVRGAEKSPGKFRITQNYIGREGGSLENATFVPPAPVRLMSDLEDFQRYIEFDDVEILIQTAIVHAQFELIHPFNDGNGRIGRLLIPLFLYQKRKLSRPIFYISSYLETHREEYYARLRGISQTKDWNSWIEFFLTSVASEARNSSDKVKNVLDLYNEMKIRIRAITHSQHSMAIQDAIFSRPIFPSSDFFKDIGINANSAKRFLRQLREADIVRELIPKKGATPAKLVFWHLINITEGKKIF